MKRPNLPHLDIRLGNLKLQENTTPTQLEQDKPSLKEKGINLKRKLSLIVARPTQDSSREKRRSYSPELEQVQEGKHPMAPSRDSEWSTARSLIRSLSNCNRHRQYLPRRSYSVDLGRSKTLVINSKFARSFRKLHRRYTSVNETILEEPKQSHSKVRISKPMPWLPPLSFQQQRQCSIDGSSTHSRSNSSSKSRHGRSTSEPQIYFTPLEALAANKLDDLEPWLGVLIAESQTDQVDFGLPGPRRRSKARLSRDMIGESSRRSALTMASVYSRASGNEEELFSNTPCVGHEQEVSLQAVSRTSPSPSPTTEEPSHRPSVPVDVDMTVCSISVADVNIPAYISDGEDEDEMEDDEDPFIYERYYRPTPIHSPIKSSSDSSTGIETPPLTRSHTPVTPKSSFNHSFLIPSTPTSPSKYRPPSPFPFKSASHNPASDSSVEDLTSSSSRASHGHHSILKESYNTLPGLPGFSITSSPQRSVRSLPPRALFPSPSTPPPNRPERRHPVGPGPFPHRRGHTHDGHTSTIRAPRERLKSLRRIASATNTPGPKAAPLLTRKLSYKAGSGVVNTSSTSLPNPLLSNSASTSTASVPSTNRGYNGASGLQLQLKSRIRPAVLAEASSSFESLTGTVGHSESHSIRSMTSESVGAVGKKVVQIRWGYI